jgi:hypothetical protein
LGLVDALKEWQSLVGAVIGAIVALSVAFIVAQMARRREDLSAAMIACGSLVSVRAAHSTLTEIATRDKVADGDYPMWIAGRLASSRPALSPLFEGCIAKLMPIDVNLAAHLDLFGTVYRSTEHHIDRVVRDIEYFQEHNKLLRSKDDATADANVIRHGLLVASKQAECTEHLLTILVLSRWRLLHRLRRMLFSSQLECKCAQLLKTGAP